MSDIAVKKPGRPRTLGDCIEDGCSIPAISRERCSRHYNRWLLAFPDAPRAPRNHGVGSTTEERFWSRVNKDGPTMPNMDTPCWVWTAHVVDDGYGTLQVNGKILRCHVYSFKLSFGDFEPGLCVLHRCDNPPCVSPGHLFLGTHTDNSRDKVNKGRQAKGEQAHAAKLTSPQVIEMRELYAKGNMTQAAIAQQFAITPQSAYRILRRKQWKHV